MKEKDLCISTGLSRDLIKEIREAYDEGLHFTRTESTNPEDMWEVEWTETGVKALRVNLGIQEHEVLAFPAKKRGKVFHKYKNPRTLGVHIDGELHTVICRDSSKFAIGMPVDIRWDGARWVIVRHPRFNGKY